MKALFKQFEIHLVVEVRKPGAPDPGFPWSDFFGDDHITLAVFDLKMIPLIAMPGILSA